MIWNKKHLVTKLCLGRSKTLFSAVFKRTLDKERVIDYINKYRGRYALNDSQNKEIENIIDKL